MKAHVQHAVSTMGTALAQAEQPPSYRNPFSGLGEEEEERTRWSSGSSIVSPAASRAGRTWPHQDVSLMSNVLLTARNCSDSAEIVQAF